MMLKRSVKHPSRNRRRTGIAFRNWIWYNFSIQTNKSEFSEVIVMERTEKVELTALCLIYKDDKILLQDRVKNDWKGFTLPGGHIEIGESIVDAIIREMKEETGLTVVNPKLCGVKQFPIKDGKYENGRYLVFLFKANEFYGDIVSSEEGSMYWISKEELENVNLVSDFNELLDVMLDDNLSEFQYIVENDVWKIIKR